MKMQETDFQVGVKSLGRVNGQDRSVNYCLVAMRVGGQVVPKGLQS